MMRGIAEKLWMQDDGTTAIEYAFIASLIAAVIASAIVPIGGKLQSIFGQLASAF